VTAAAAQLQNESGERVRMRKERRRYPRLDVDLPLELTLPNDGRLTANMVTHGSLIFRAASTKWEIAGKLLI
jgi:hypothetical protein